MRFSFFLFFFFLSFCDLFGSGEIKRIDSVVHDIALLQKGYEEKLAGERKKILNLENQLQQLQKRLKSSNLRPLCNDENPFPKLKPKETKTVHFKAAAFRLKKDADIYSGKDSYDVIAHWEKRRSFTSNIKTDNRIKITGYFVNRVWQKAKKEMWVELCNVQKR